MVKDTSATHPSSEVSATFPLGQARGLDGGTRAWSVSRDAGSPQARDGSLLDASTAIESVMKRDVVDLDPCRGRLGPAEQGIIDLPCRGQNHPRAARPRGFIPTPRSRQRDPTVSEMCGGGIAPGPSPSVNVPATGRSCRRNRLGCSRNSSSHCAFFEPVEDDKPFACQDIRHTQGSGRQRDSASYRIITVCRTTKREAARRSRSFVTRGSTRVPAAPQ
jgi:hypothetical protein